MMRPDSHRTPAHRPMAVLVALPPMAALVALLLVAGCATTSTPEPQTEEEKLSKNDVLRLRYAMAENLVKKKDYTSAVPYIQSVLDQYPDNIRLRLMLGTVLREKGMYGSAEKELKLVMKKAPNSAQALSAYGVLLDKMGRHTQAEAHHRRAIKLADKNAQYHNNLGFCLFLQRKLDDAKESLQEAIHLDPGMRRAYNNLGFVYGLDGNREAAMNAFSQGGSQPMALTNMGVVEEMRGQPLTARRYYERALKERPDFEPALRNLSALDSQISSSASTPASNPTQPQPDQAGGKEQ